MYQVLLLLGIWILIGQFLKAIEKKEKKEKKSKDLCKIDGWISRANIAKSLYLFSITSYKSIFESDINFIFVVTTIITSHVYIEKSLVDTWSTNNEVSEHMINYNK